jgi:hypothetical protein
MIHWLNDFRSRCSSVVEHFLGKEEAVSSILINGSKIFEIEFEGIQESIPTCREGQFVTTQQKLNGGPARFGIAGNINLNL